MKIIKHDTAKEIEYFNLEKFVNNIKLEPKILEHMQETNINFDKYFKQLSKYNDEFMLYFWISLAYDEIKNSNFVERHNFKNFDLSISDLFFDKLSISHNRIHNIHKFVMKNENETEKIGKYRKTDVRVSNITQDTEEIFWYGAKPEDIKKFMDSFIKIYKTNNISIIDSNPFLKSALIHLLFIKIHPYYDGNGRSARIIHNIKFTETLNRLYNMNLKICPVNLSESINLNLISYMKSFDNIYFDLKHDNNDAINYWFDFILNMYDEQLYNKKNMINNIDEIMERIITIKEKINLNDIKLPKNSRIRK